MANQDLVSPIIRVNTAANGTQASTGHLSYPPDAVFSPDGTRVLFASIANNLGSDHSNSYGPFVKDLVTGAIVRVSTAADGTLANSPTNAGSFSPDGTLVLFQSNATNLVPGDTNNAYDQFIKNLATGTIVRVSTAADDTQANGHSEHGIFSPDGTRLLFLSAGSNLVPDDTNNGYDLFVKNIATGAIVRVNTAADGTQSIRGLSGSEAIFSPDGTRVLFESFDTNLVPGDTNGARDLFVKDLATGAIARVNTAADGTQGDAEVRAGIFSPDGTRVLFSSFATNLVPGDTNDALDLFVKHLVTGAITRISTAADGTQANFDTLFQFAAFSPDGTRVLFRSTASNLVPGDSSNVGGLFVKDLATGAITRVDTSANGEAGNSGISNFAFSSDGTRVLFLGFGTNLVPGDTNGGPDYFVKDLTTGGIIRVNTTADGTQANFFSGLQYPAMFSPDGNRVLFTSGASNLVPDDTNNDVDIFVKSLLPAATTVSVAADQSSRAEGNAGTAALTFTITRGGDTAGITSLTWSVAGTGPNPTNAADFSGNTIPTGIVAFAPSETSATVTVAVAGDLAQEYDESFVLTLALQAPSLDTVVEVNTAAATILDDDALDPAITLAIAAANATRAEGDAGTNPFTFTVTRTGNLLGSASADWSVQGTGLRPANAADFAGNALPSGTVTFGQLETQKTITIPVAGDTAVETHEGFVVTLSNPSANVTLTPAAAQGTITADDAIVDLAVANVSSGQPMLFAPTYYVDPVAGVEKQWIIDTTDNINVTAAGPNWFIHTGGGNDGIVAASGRNVLDGGTGSNFLTGGSGHDTFFLDARGGGSIWSTIVDFAIGDEMTLWGYVAGTSADGTDKEKWYENQGVDPHKGLTIHAKLDGTHFGASVTFANLTFGDRDKLAVSTGNSNGNDYLYVTRLS